MIEMRVIGILNFPIKIIRKSITNMLEPNEMTNFSKIEKGCFFPKTANIKKYPGINNMRAIEI
jgi:hypothetical protein